MANYANGLIEAADINGYVNSVNNLRGVGNGSYGYGSPSLLSGVAPGQVIQATHWSNNLRSAISSLMQHQSGTTYSAYRQGQNPGNFIPVAGDKIYYMGAEISSAISSITANRLNAIGQGASAAYPVTNYSTWSDYLEFTHVITFGSGDKARYFFNGGGQISINCSHPNGSGINAVFSQLATQIGTIKISAPNAGAVTIAGTSYNGVTKVGGSGTTPQIQPNKGYYGLTTMASDTLFIQNASTGPNGYLGSIIGVLAYTNGPQTGNGDNGSTITIKTLFNEIPNGMLASGGSICTITISPPSSLYIPDAWSTVAVNGYVSSVA